MKKEDKEILMERFEIFYKAYPRKVSKGQAIKTWLKLAPNEETLDKMLEALKWQVELKSWAKKDFIPHPSTWLNAMKWEDECDKSLLVGSLTTNQKDELMKIQARKRMKMRGENK
jgi:hypothetical protein